VKEASREKHEVSGPAGTGFRRVKVGRRGKNSESKDSSVWREKICKEGKIWGSQKKPENGGRELRELLKD